MFALILFMFLPIAVCLVSYYWGHLWAVDPLTSDQKLFALWYFGKKNLEQFEEADTLRPPPRFKDDFRLSPAEIAEGWNAVKVDGCWIKVLDVSKVDLLSEEPFEEEEPTIHTMDPEYLALIESLAKDFDGDERPTVRPNPTKD